jgi:hypothetical protein
LSIEEQFGSLGWNKKALPGIESGVWRDDEARCAVYRELHPSNLEGKISPVEKFDESGSRLGGMTADFVDDECAFWCRVLVASGGSVEGGTCGPCGWIRFAEGRSGEDQGLPGGPLR